MPMSQAELAIVLTMQDRASAQLREVGKDVAGLEKQAESTGGALSRMGGALKGLGTIGLAAGGIGAIAGGVQDAIGAIGGLVAQASDLNEQISRTGAIFGEAGDAVVEFSRTTAQSLGITKTEALEAAGNFGQLLRTSGLSADAAADMSTNLVRLAADLASFNNISPTEALEKLRSGLTGEAEPLRSVGVLLSEDAVKAKALELGLGGATGELTEAAKVQARFALIMQQTATAQGDFARTSTGLANAQRILKASWADVTAELGGVFLPMVAQAASWLAQNLPAAIQRAREVLGQLGNVLRAVASGDFKGALDQIITLVSGLADRLRPVLAQWGEAFLTWVRETVPPLLAQLSTLAGDVFAWVAEQAPAFVEKLTGEWGPAFLEWVAPLIPPLIRELGKLLVGITDWTLTTGLPYLARLGVALGDAMVKGLARALLNVGPTIGQALDDAFRQYPLIASLVSAGLLGPTGGALLNPAVRQNVASAGPAAGAVAGAASAAGGGITVNVGGVDVEVGVDPMAAAQQVGAQVAAQVYAALMGSAAATDPGASPMLAGAGR